jgi:hypothetical protein
MQNEKHISGSVKKHSYKYRIIRKLDECRKMIMYFDNVKDYRKELKKI